MKIKLSNILLVIVLVAAAIPLMANGSDEELENPDLLVIIDGMYCALCSDAVTKSFETNEDVMAVSANYKTGTAAVVLANKNADLEKLTDIFELQLADLGYTLVSIKKGSTND